MGYYFHFFIANMADICYYRKRGTVIEAVCGRRYWQK